MGNIISSNNNTNSNFDPTKLPGCKIWLDATDPSTIFTTDYENTIEVSSDFTPTSISGCATWFDSSDTSTLYSTSAGNITAVSNPTQISGCALWLDSNDSSATYMSYAGPVSTISSPLDISGCQGWWDASDISSMFQDTAQTVAVTNSGDPVAVLRDKSGANIHAIQSSSTSSRPTYTANLANNKSGLFFDGVDDFLLANRSASSTHTILAVLYPTVTLNGAASPISINYLACYHPSNSSIMWFASNTGNYLTGAYNFDQFPQIVGWTNNNSVVTGYKNSYVTFSGNAEPSVSTSSGLQIGRRDAGYAYFTGYICEIVHFNKVLSTSERASLEQYFTNKWGIAQIHGLSSTAGRVGYVGDKSGNNYHAKQLLENNRPTRAVFPSTSANSLLFNKSQTHYLTIDNFPYSVSSNYTFFIVIKPNSLSNNDVILGKNHTTCFGTALWSSSGITLRSTNGGQYTLYNDLNPSIITISRSSSTTHFVFRNGDHISNFAAAANSTSVADLLSSIGSSCNGNYPYDGYIGEIIVFNRELSLSERGRIEKYLSNKWNLSDPHIAATTTGGPIGCWLDKSGNNRHATQTISSYRPSRSGVVNNLQAITFDGTDDYFDLGDLSSAYPSFGEVFIVFEPNNAANYELYQTSQNYPIYLYSGSSFFGAFTSSRAAPGTIAAPTAGVHVTSMRANSSSMTVRLDGNTWHTQTGLGYNAGTVHAIGYSNQGTGTGVGGIVMNGKIVEVISYNRDIGAADRARVEQYLAKKWGISDKLHDYADDGKKVGLWKSKGTNITYSDPFLGVRQQNIYRRPTLGSSINGKNCVEFFTPFNYLVNNNINFNSTPSCSVFYVARISNSSNFCIFRLGGMNTANIISRSQTQVEFGGAVGLNIGKPNTINSPFIESIIKNSGFIHSTTSLLRNNISFIGNGYGVNQTSGIASGPLTLSSFWGDALSDNVTNVVIGEFIYYDRALSNDERGLVEKYLYDKWNIDQNTNRVSKPTDISGCSLWLDADDIDTLFKDTTAATPVSVDGDSVAYWADKVGGQDVIQATASARPTYRISIQNGKPMIYFDGGDDLLSQVNRTYTAPCTLFVVCRIDAHSGDLPGIFTHGDSTGGLSGPGFIYNGSFGLVILDGSGAGSSNSSNMSTTILGLPRILSGVYTQANTSGSSLYVNGNLEENFTGTGVALNAAANRVQIGARTGGGQNTRRMIGYIAECIRYDRVLTDTERASVENYLSEKWGLGCYSAPNNIGSGIIRHKIKVSNKDAQNWIDRVFANGGSVSQQTAEAVDKFCRDIDSAGLRKKFYRLNLFCGNDLQACLTPLYLGPDSERFYGFRTEQNTGFFQNNYDEKNGLIAGPGSSTGGNGIYLLTGVSLSAMGLSDTGHMAFYQTQFNIDTNPYNAGNRPIIGAGNTSIALQGSNNVQSYYGGFSSIESPYFGGLFVLTRNSSSDMKSYETGLLTGSQTSAITIPDQTSDVGIFTSTNGSAASGANYYYGYVKGYSVGKSMTEQEVAQYNNIMENFQKSLGRGLAIRASSQFTAVTNEETKSWIDAVYANGGTISTATALAVNNLANSIESAGIRNKFYRLNLFCGDNLAACVVPLYRGPSRLGLRYGNTKDINVSLDGYGYYANSDNFNYIENQGLLGNTQEIAGNSNVSRRYLNTGLITGSISQLNNSLHTAIYSRTLNAGGFAMGAYDSANTGFTIQITPKGYNIGAFANSLLNHTNTETQVMYPSNKGFYVGNYNGYILTTYEGRGATIGQRDLTATYALVPPTVSSMGVFGENRATVGIALFNYLDRLQSYSIGSSLSTSDVQTYHDIIQTFQTSLSRANTDPVLGSQFDSITNLDTRDWLTRVYKNGGTVSIATATAVQNFCNSIDSAGIRDRFYRLNLFCGDNLEACTVPLYRGDSRTGTQRGFFYDIPNNITISDYNESGILSGIKGNGSNKYLETGLGTDFTNNSSLSFGAFITSPTETAFSTYLGVFQTNNADATVLYYRDGFTRGLDGSTFYPSAPTDSILTGHHIYSRTASNSYFHGWNGTSGTTSNSAASTRGRAGFTIHAMNNNGTMANYGNGRISMYHIGLGLTTQQVSSFNNALVSFNQAMGRTRPSSQFASVTNEDAKIWIDNVYSNGGTVSTTTASAVNTLCNSINSNNLRNKFYRMNLFCGNNLNAAMVPLYKGPDISIQYGSIYDIGNNLVSLDYKETGIGAGVSGDGSSKYINTNLAPSQMPGNGRTGHIGAYITKSTTINNSRILGSSTSSGAERYEIYHGISTNSMGSVYSGPGGGGTILSYKNNAQEFYIVNRNSVTNARFYTGGQGRVVTSTNISGQLTEISSAPFVALARNTDTGVANYSNASICIYSIGTALTDSEHSALYTIIETFNTALGRGRSSTNFASVDNEDAKIWIDTIYSNGATVSSSTANAINKLCNDIDNAGLRSKFYRLNLFCGDNLVSCITPLYSSQTTFGNRYGNIVDTNNGFISSDFNENSGLIGNGSTKWLDTGLPQNFSTYRHFGVVMNKLPTVTYRMIMGAKANAATLDWTSDTRLQTDGSTNIASFWTGNSSGQLSTGISLLMAEKTFVVGLTDSDGLNKLYSDTLTTNFVGTISSPDTTSVGIFAQKIGATGLGSSHTDARLSLYTIGIELSSSQIATLTSIIDTFNDSLGRGKPSNTFASVTNDDAKLWINRVYTNGGSISSNTASAVNSFCNSIDANGLRSKFYRLNLMCGDNLSAALVPLYIGPARSGIIYGYSVDQNNNFVPSDYTEPSGIKGSVSTLKYLLTNVQQSSLTSDNRHLSVYERIKNTLGYGTLIGSDNGDSNVSSWSLNANGDASAMGYYAGAGNDYVFSTSYSGPSFWLGTGSSTQSRIYRNGTLDSSGTISSGTPGSSTVGIFVKNSSTLGPVIRTDATIGMYSIGLSFNDSDVATFNQSLMSFNSGILRA